MNTSIRMSLKIFYIFIIIHHVGALANANTTKMSTDKCEYESDYKCGNLCTFENNYCPCGTALLSQHSPEYCCLPPGETCTGDWHNPDCRNGHPRHKSEPCNGVCHEKSVPTHIKEEDGAHLACAYDENCLVRLTSTGVESSSHYWCGDRCTHFTSTCICGDVTMHDGNTQHYCCLPPGQHCTSSGGKETICSSGRPVHKSKPCHGSCPEDSGSSTIDADGNLMCGYSDQCQFSSQMTSFYFYCGNICTVRENCNCGGVNVERSSDQYCCTEEEDHCTATLLWDNFMNPTCASGEVKNRDEPCNGRCYNSYQHSYNIENARYTCPDGRCVHVTSVIEELNDRCRGVQIGVCTNTNQECDRNLFCRSEEATQLSLKSESVVHHYCSHKKYRNTDEYEDIGRTDEDIENILTSVRKKVTDSLIPCYSYGNTPSLRQPGVFCGHVCKHNDEWCRSEDRFLDTCEVGNTFMKSSHKQICGDNVFWRDIDCHGYSGGRITTYGLRCRGSYHHCLRPWYYTSFGSTWLNGVKSPSCSDKSDQLAFLNTPCPEFAVYRQVHATIPHGYEYYVTFAMTHSPLPREAEDPHRCWDSCSSPGPRCLACTNEDFFLCQQSGVCIPKELLCDGHPQCSHGEDEGVDTCLESWVSKKIVSPAASLRCSSSRYPGTPTLGDQPIK